MTSRSLVLETGYRGMWLHNARLVCSRHMLVHDCFCLFAAAAVVAVAAVRGRVRNECDVTWGLDVYLTCERM